MPGQNQRVVTGLQEAAKSQMQQQLGGQLTGQPLGIRQIEAAGQQATAMQAQPLLQVQQQAQQQAQQLGGLALKEEAQSAQKRLQERQFNQAKAQRDAESQLNTLNSGLKQRLLDDQFTFQKDELGRTFFNERQLLDYKVSTAKSALEVRDLEQKMRKASSRKMQILKAAQAKINQDLTQEFQKGEQELNQEQLKRLTEAQRAMQDKIRREEARAKNRGSMFSALGTLAGVGLSIAVPALAPYAIPLAMGGSGAGSLLAGSTKI